MLFNVIEPTKPFSVVLVNTQIFPIKHEIMIRQVIFKKALKWLNDLDVSFNKNLGTDCFGKLGLVVTQCHVERFNARYCNLTAEGMEAFKENTPNAKIKFLNLSGNKVSRLGDEGLSTIREIVHQCQVETLAMMECDFNPDQLERFKTLIADTGVKFILQIESTG